MKPAPFEYVAPDTLEEATEALRQYGEEAKVLAGGQSLIPMLNMRLARFDALVDVARIEELKKTRADMAEVTIGAMVRQSSLTADGDPATSVPLLAKATRYIGHFQIRNRGTLGGSLAHADPAAEYPAVALALDARMNIFGPAGRRSVPAANFFHGTWLTSLSSDEILESVTFPKWGNRSAFAIEEVARRHGDFAIAGAAVGIEATDGTLTRAAISLFGMGGTPLRAGAAEQALVSARPEDVDPRAVGHAALDGVDPPEDLHASAALRRRIGAAVVSRAVATAMKELV